MLNSLNLNDNFNQNFNQSFNIIDLFFEQVSKNPQKLAIISPTKQITFEELAQEIQQTSAYFLKKGIKKGDKVLVFVGMGIDLYRIVLAIFNIGAVAVFLDAWVSKARMELCCKIADCVALVGNWKVKFLSFFSKELYKIPIKLGLFFPKNLENNFTKNTEITAQDPALITFTTGSTGTPKGAIRTHIALLAQFEALISKINPSENEINMPVLPIILLLNLASGVTSILANCKPNKLKNFKPKKIISQLQKYEVNSLISSPFFIKKLSEYVISQNLKLPFITKIFTGGSPVFAQEAHIYTKAFPNTHIEIVYGSTEAEPISSALAKDIVNFSVDFSENQDKKSYQKGLFVGKIDPNTNLKIIKINENAINIHSKEELEQITLFTHEIGEIIVSGNHILEKYIQNEEAIKRNKIFVGEKNICWHRTGDSGYVDEKNNLFLTGRCAYIIQKHEKMIFPFICENHFLQIEGINIATILEVNQKIIIFVEINKKTNKHIIYKKLSKLCMEFYIEFDEIIFLAKIPRDLRHHSKIDYARLIDF